MRPSQEAIRQRRAGSLRIQQLPIVGGFGLELVINPARGEVLAKVEQPLGERRGRRRDDAGNFNRLAGEKIGPQHIRRGNYHLAGGGRKISVAA